MRNNRVTDGTDPMTPPGAAPDGEIIIPMDDIIAHHAVILELTDRARAELDRLQAPPELVLALRSILDLQRQAAKHLLEMERLVTR